jgi:hypothetical protein
LINDVAHERLLGKNAHIPRKGDAKSLSAKAPTALLVHELRAKSLSRHSWKNRSWQAHASQQKAPATPIAQRGPDTANRRAT